MTLNDIPLNPVIGKELKQILKRNKFLTISN